jgi:hypothetical protein
METTTSASYVESRAYPILAGGETNSSGVAWGAVIGGAFGMAAFSLILLALGAGLGLSAVSPWSNVGAAASTIDKMAVIWLILIEIVSSALGGYLTGRLRTKWALIHTDEVFFRDTANGLLAWAVALVITVTFLASAGAAMVGGSEQLGSTADRSGTAATVALNPEGYFVDTLFRSDHRNLDTTDSLMQAEAGRIFANALRQKEMPLADQAYLTGLITAKTGIDQAQAEKRISEAMTQARQAAETARSATARFLLWFFLALLMGAFSASYFATIGGKLRDHVKLT